MVRLSCLLLGLAVPFSCHAQMTQEEAFSLGKSAGAEETLKELTGSITNDLAGTLIFDFNADSRPAGSVGYSGGVLSTLQAGGVSKIGECSSGQSGSSPAAAQHCAAVNAIMQQANTPASDIITPSDQLIVKGKSIALNPELYAEPIETGYSECVQKTVVKKGDSIVDTCEDYLTNGSVSCSTSSQLDLTTNYLYKCSETIAVQASSSCIYGRRIELDEDTNYRCDTNVQSTSKNKCSIVRVASVKLEDGFVPAGVTAGAVTIGVGFGPSNQSSEKATATAVTDGAGGYVVTVKTTGTKVAGISGYYCNPVTLTKSLIVPSGLILFGKYNPFLSGPGTCGNNYKYSTLSVEISGSKDSPTMTLYNDQIWYGGTSNPIPVQFKGSVALKPSGSQNYTVEMSETDNCLVFK